jgi:endonuclease/exonuclease/phosphatase family metal-dependent hydrolase
MTYKNIPLAVVPLMLLCLGTCEGTASQQAEPSELTLAVWNVQTLFDGTEDGDEYLEYTRGWNSEKYQARLNALSQAIERMGQTPDIIGLVEVENAGVLEDFVRGPLAKHGYGSAFFGARPSMGLGIGVISRFPFEQTLLHSITDDGRTVPRPMVEVHVRVRDQTLALFVCHWKSKLEGDDETEPARKDGARIALRRLRELEAEGLPVVIMGDLNENHDEFYRRGLVPALLPDDPDAVALAGDLQQDFLILSSMKPPLLEHFSAGAIGLYSPWGNELQGGSYYYQHQWETIDHLLLSEALFDRAGWEFGSCFVINQEPFIKVNGSPARYELDTGNGLSDHLPLMLKLVME